MAMLRPLYSRLALPAFLAALSANAHAVDMRAAAELMYFNYEEIDIAGNRLNKETGYIPGISITASQRIRTVYHSLEFSAYGGDVNYDGQTQSGAPHQTTTEQGIYRLTYRISAPLKTTDAELYGRIYWQRWDRDIQPNNNVLGLFERYEWWSIEGGAEVPLMRRDRQDLLLGLGMLTTLYGTIEIDLSSAGFGESVLDLGDGIGFFGEVRYDLRWWENASLQIGIRYRTWEFGRSDTKTISNGTESITITEPESQTAQTTLFAGYVHRF